MAALAASGCATTVPLQTASTVPAGVVRLSGQLSSSPWCSVTTDLKNCAYSPGNGSVSVPELRLNGRVGVHDRVDLGLSAFANYVVGSGFRWGGQFDGKVELWRREIEPGRKHVLSAGLGLGLTRLDDSRTGRTEDLSYLQMDVVVPVRYGYQLESMELFGGPHFIERISFNPPGIKGVAEVPWLGLSAGFVTRGKAKFGLALSYESPLRFFDGGAFSVTAGFLVDLGGKPGDRDAAVRPLQEPAAASPGS
jgi:hypothetical protein